MLGAFLGSNFHKGVLVIHLPLLLMRRLGPFAVDGPHHHSFSSGCLDLKTADYFSQQVSLLAKCLARAQRNFEKKK